jgi:hypothetical protein
MSWASTCNHIRVLGVPLQWKVMQRTKELEATAESLEGLSAVRFRPAIPQPILDALRDAIEPYGSPEIAEEIRHLPGKFAALRPEDRTATNAACYLLADLLEKGWAAEVHNGDIWVWQPDPQAKDGELLEEVKHRLRSVLLVARNRQLANPAVRDFVRKMERPRLYKHRRLSIANLIDDGSSLATALSEVAMQPPSARGHSLDKIIYPILQVATADERCEHTGYSLLDIWRYFRHTWSLEYRTTPGRSLYLLIRNGARPFAPVMGIASLANAPLQLRLRDSWVGWSTQSVVASAQKNTGEWPEIRDALLKTIRNARREIRADDLMVLAGGAEGKELEERLQSIAAAARTRRSEELKEWRERINRGEEVPPLRRQHKLSDGTPDWHTGSETSLFLAKRAKTLSDLMFAERVISDLPSIPYGLADLFKPSNPARRALSIATREIRKVGLASRLLDLNVCGAVPPYRDLLGGKLTALAVLSAEVAQSYALRYLGQESEIASQMAGQAVSRDANVCVLTTTSLYGIAASQYNRLKHRVSTQHGEALLHWQDLGLTKGYGTTHLSEATVRALREVSIGQHGRRTINNLFGEGQSPRLRQVRDGLDILGLDSDAYLRHSNPRRIYAAEIFPGAKDALRLNHSVYATAAPFEAIREVWRERWLARRITNSTILARVATQGPQTIHEELRPRSAKKRLASEAQHNTPFVDCPSPRMADMGKKSQPELIESLYRARGACADHHDDDTVTEIHIETQVEAFVRKNAPGRVLFITGNPGDGKTHLLKRLQNDLKSANVKLCLDANEREDTDLLKLVRGAIKHPTQGLAIAINEGTLVQLLRQAEGESWANSARDQLLRPLLYKGDEPKSDPRVKIVDLNLRNNLARPVVEQALKVLLLLSGPSDSCPGAPRCDLQVNAIRLQDRPVERVDLLLEAVSQLGFHATMRDLQGFLAYLLMAQTSCGDTNESSGSSPYWRNAFEGGDGPLFDMVRRLDPKLNTSPLLDDKLWRRADSSSEWLLHWPERSTPAEGLLDRLDWFIDRKRRALFEHKEGASLLAANDPVDRFLLDVLRAPDPTNIKRILRLINRFFDRDDQTSEHLHLWMVHRYDARPAHHAASANTVHHKEFELLVPKLRGELEAAFPDYKSDHAVLCSRGMTYEEGLRIDRPLLEALLASNNGLPSNFRRGEPEVRISNFINRLAKKYGSLTHDNRVEIKLVDVNTGANIIVAVDLTASKYVAR